MPNTMRAETSGETTGGALRRKLSVRKKPRLDEAGPLFSDMLNLLNTLLEKQDINELFKTVARSVRRIMGADAVFFVENKDPLCIGRYSGPSMNKDWEGVEIFPGKSIAGEVISSKSIVWTPNILNEEYYCSGFHNSEGMHAFCGAPIFVDDRVYGVLVISWRAIHQPTDLEQTLIAVAADSIADSLETIETLNEERRREELRAGYRELEALATKSANNMTEATKNSRHFFTRLEEILRVKAELFVTNTKKAPKGSPLRAYYPSRGENGKNHPASVPYELFRKFADSEDMTFFETLEDNEEIRQWAEKNYGIAHGVVLSNRRVLDSIGCMICGRPEGEPPLSPDERTILQAAANDMTLGSIDRLLKFEDANISHALQDSLANEVSSGPQFSVEDFYLSATSGSHVGGDFYQVFEASDHYLVAILGDVSGKGVNLASLGFLVKNVVSSYLEKNIETPLSEVVDHLNEILYYAHDVHRFVSLVILVIDETTGEGAYCCAGHPPALLYRMATGDCEPLDAASPLVGALNNMQFKSEDLRFERDDVLLLYTDGATEARSPRKGSEFFGERCVERAFCEEVVKGFTGVTTRMFERINEFAEEQLSDDMALLALRYNGSGD